MSSSYEFAKFVKNKEKYIIRFYFVVCLFPLNPFGKVFPITLKVGNANREVVNQFINIIEIVKDEIPVVDFAFDG